MKYPTSLYFRDLFLPYDILFSVFKKSKKLILGEIHKLRFFNRKLFFRNVWHNTPYAMFIFFLGFLAVFKIAIAFEEENGLRVLNLTTGSMRPSIPKATLVVTKPSSNYKIGDIITYREVSPSTGLLFSKTLTHRIVDIKTTEGEELYMTRGDANELPDPYLINKKDILGKVFFTVPYAGYILLLIKSLPGFLLIIVVPAVLLIFNEINYIRKESGWL